MMSQYESGITFDTSVKFGCYYETPPAPPKTCFDFDAFKKFEKTIESLWGHIDEIENFKDRNSALMSFEYDLDPYVFSVLQTAIFAEEWNRTNKHEFILHSLNAIQSVCNPLYPAILNNKKAGHQITKSEWSERMVDQVEFLSTLPYEGINDKDPLGYTALMLACYGPCQNIALIEKLVEMGADLNAQNFDGNTALMLACHGPFINLPIIKKLVEMGADLSLKNLKKHNCLNIADSRKSTEIFYYFFNLDMNSPNFKPDYLCDFIQIEENPKKTDQIIDVYSNCFNPAVVGFAMKRKSQKIPEMIKAGIKEDQYALVISTLEKIQRIDPFDFGRMPEENPALFREIVDALIVTNTAYGFGDIHKRYNGNRYPRPMSWHRMAYEMNHLATFNLLIENSDYNTVCNVFQYQYPVNSHLMPFLESHKHTYNPIFVKIAFQTNVPIAISMCHVGLDEGKTIVLKDIVYPFNDVVIPSFLELFERIGSSSFDRLVHLIDHHKISFFIDWILDHCCEKFNFCGNDVYRRVALKMIEYMLECVKDYDTCFKRCLEALKNQSKYHVFKFIEVVFGSGIDTKSLKCINKTVAEIQVLIYSFMDGYYTVPETPETPNPVLRFMTICSLLNQDTLNCISNVFVKRNVTSTIPSIYIEKACHKFLSE